MMQEFFFEIKKTVGKVALFISVLMAGACIEGQLSTAVGLLTGALTSVIYYLLLCYRIKKAAGLSLSKAVFSMRIGFVIRFLFILLMLILSLRVSYIGFWAAIVGLFSLHIVVLLSAVTTLFKGFTQRK